MENNEVAKVEITKQDLVTTSMKNYLSASAVDAYITSMLGDRKSSFITTLTSMAGSGTKLANCNKQSIMMAALKAVGMNLPIDQNLGFAWIIPYNDMAQFQLGAKGILQLALRTGNYRTINVIEVVEGEFKGRDWIGEPVIQFLGESERINKKIVGYVAGYETLNGMRKVVYWTTEAVEKHADRFSQGYKAFKKYGKSQSTAKSGNLSNPWETDFNSMAKKTVLKNLLSQYGELTTETGSLTQLGQALKMDQSVITIDDNMNETIKYIDNPSTPEDTGRITKAQQELLLKTYSAEIINEALYIAGIEDITLIQTDTFDEFVKSCVKLQKEAEKLSK